jgi:hypothetical protein
MVPELGKVLREHKLASPFSQPGDFVFSAPDGRGRDRRSTSRGIERAVERAGVGPLSFHGLRHGFASMLIVGLKADVETVSRQLGHANSSITLSVYSHEFDRARNADELRAAISGAFGHLVVKPADDTARLGRINAFLYPLRGPAPPENGSCGRTEASMRTCVRDVAPAHCPPG